MSFSQIHKRKRGLKGKRRNPEIRCEAPSDQRRQNASLAQFREEELAFSHGAEPQGSPSANP